MEYKLQLSVFIQIRIVMRYILIALLGFTFSIINAQEKKNWTIMHYSVGSNSSEMDLLSDIEEMKRGKISNEYNLITMIDRIEGFSEDSLTLDGNFTDTRLYEINQNSFRRLEGKEFFPELHPTKSYEANMADAEVLKKFIQYTKKYYPANNYMLVLRSHGNGVSMCPDGEDGTTDRIYPAEMTEVLTEQESVNILGLDVCSMAGLENLYQWRPRNHSFYADFVIASSPLSGAWAYDAILKRVSSKSSDPQKTESNFFKGGEEQNLDPKSMTALDFSNLVIEEIYDNQRWSSWGLFDNSKVEKAKVSIDKAAQHLSSEDPEVIIKTIHKTLGYHHNTSDNIEIAHLTSPYLDAYHFWTIISQSDEMSTASKKAAKEVQEAIDELVISSYYGRGYFPDTDDFDNGKSGVYQIIPRGNDIFSQSKRSFWSHCGWFHPDDISNEQNSYGLYDWCINGATRGNNRVENFYELLDHLFDHSNDKKGGVNGYQW